ncbi:hypothetical protein Q5752_003856 [Cryptotrichosporon argae]
MQPRRAGPAAGRPERDQRESWAQLNKSGAHRPAEPTLTGRMPAHGTARDGLAAGDGRARLEAAVEAGPGRPGAVVGSAVVES